MNKDFEKLPEIKKLLDGGDVYWCKHSGKYRGYDEDFANGALYAYQEQQKIIDEYQAKLDEFLGELTKTENEDKDNKVDYWRGFAECAGSVKDVFLRDVGRLK